MAGIDINARFDQLEGILVDVLLELRASRTEFAEFKQEMTEFKGESENRFAVLEAIVTDLQTMQREQTRTNAVLADAILRSLPNHNERIVALENAVFVNPR